MRQKCIPAPDLKPTDSRRPWSWQLLAIEVWESPGLSLLLAFVLYVALAQHHGPLWPATPVAYYNYLADALLHGQIHLRVLPPTTYDLSFFEGRYYLYWGPFPAVLLMPLVALFGVQVSDILFTLAIGAFNVALVAMLLRSVCEAQIVTLSRVQRGLLVLFFALGTVHVTLVPLGRVWFTGQIVGFMCVALAYLAAIRLYGAAAFGLAGLAMACALLTRNHLVLSGLWPAIYLLYRHRSATWPRLAGFVLLGMLPVVLAVLLLGAYNWLRFGSMLDPGLDYHQMGQVFRADYARYGAFHLHYLPTNLYYQYVAYPFPLGPTSFQGGSLFLLSPVFCAVFWGIATGYPRWIAWALAATVVLANLPILFLMGTGWVQFGPRYSLDFMLPLLLLTAIGIRRWPAWVLAVLTSIAAGSYLLGALLLGELLRLK